MLDLENSVAVPVDYKRGRVPDVPGNAWEPEQVQLCAQGLILRENGYQCEGGILYFIESRRRVSVRLRQGTGRSHPRTNPAVAGDGRRGDAAPAVGR